MIDNGYKGIVIAGTGLGHVNKPLYPALKRAQEKGVQVYMTVQTLWGYVQMYVYETGREMMELGVIPLANMLPEVAYIKLGWALGQTQDAEEVKKTNAYSCQWRDYRKRAIEWLSRISGWHS